ncbi:amidase [Agrobacterium vitis]
MSADTKQPFDTSAMAALAAIRGRDISAQELISRFLARIEHDNGHLHALRHGLSEQAMQDAAALDMSIRAGENLPVLAGLPVVVKENCDTAGVSCSAGLAFRTTHVPAGDSWITARLRAAGAIIVGLSVSDPGAFGTRTAEVTHPADPDLTVGGSSGGSGAALAAGFCLGAIGTDTGGSIRIPSACCSTVGLKPSFGALPMEGIFPLVKSLDHVGPMAQSVDDVAVLWRALTLVPPVPVSKPRRVGYDPAWIECADAPIRDAMRLALERLAENNVQVVEVKLPALDDVVSMHGRIFLVEAAAYHCAQHPTDIDAYPALARDWFAAAREMSVGAYVDACVERAAMTRAVDSVLQNVDAILAPTLCVARPEKAAELLAITGVQQDFTMGMVRLTCLFNHTGHPAVSLPVHGASDPLASSIQVIGPKGGEERVLGMARMVSI